MIVPPSWANTGRRTLKWIALIIGVQLSLVKGITKENILGIEAPLWTETITNMDEIEYMVFPRLIGYAEISWSPAEGRSWNEYKLRLAQTCISIKSNEY